MDGNRNDSGAKRRIKRLWWTALGVGISAVVIVAVFLMMPTPTPEEVARQWVQDNVDWAGEQTAGFILRSLGQEGLDAIILKELGGEWIEDHIHEHVVWYFLPAAPHGDARIVVATARVDFEVVQPPVKGRVQAAVPFKLEIKGSRVINQRVMLMDASANVNFADIDIGVDAEKVKKGVKDLFGRQRRSCHGNPLCPEPASGFTEGRNDTGTAVVPKERHILSIDGVERAARRAQPQIGIPDMGGN